MSLIKSSAITRKQQLINEELLTRTSGSGKEVPYAPRQPWRNNLMYLLDDSVLSGNGNPFVCIEPNRGKPPENNPQFWKPDVQPTVQRWSDIPVGTAIPVGLEVIHNSSNWVCAQAHTKTAGNGPRQGSTIWTPKI